MRLHTHHETAQQPRRPALFHGLRHPLRRHDDVQAPAAPRPPAGQEELDLRDLDQRVRESGEW